MKVRMTEEPEYQMDLLHFEKVWISKCLIQHLLLEI